MASETASKLNRLQRLLPEGMLVDAAWLEREGYTHPLRQKYVTSGWLTMPVRGVYRRPAAGDARKEPFDWRAVVMSLQTLMTATTTVGGRTALELLGLGHYLPQRGRPTVHLYMSERVPTWLVKLPVNASFVFHRHDRLFGAVEPDQHRAHLQADLANKLSPELPGGEGFMQQQGATYRWPMVISTPERAVLELLEELPERESFEHVDKLFGGLANLSPRRLQRLLEACHSIKVKRLFFFFADRHDHKWLLRLDRERISLGAGKRALVAHGRYDPKYRITVPAFLMDKTDAV